MGWIEEKWVEVPVEGAAMAAFLATPSAEAPGLVMLQEIFGINAAMQAKARGFAELGYAVLVPDLFWRLQPRVALGYSEAERQSGFGFLQRFDFAKGTADIAAAATWLEKAGGVSRRVGVIGFCLGGRLAIAATSTYAFAAVASLYGVRLDLETERLKAFQAPLQIHVGDNDAHVPRDTIGKVREALEGRPNAEVFVYPGAQHGFFNAARPEVYAPEAAALAERRITAMLQKALGR
jgi:carboxymethylenebutenolidase